MSYIYSRSTSTSEKSKPSRVMTEISSQHFQTIRIRKKKSSLTTYKEQLQVTFVPFYSHKILIIKTQSDLILLIWFKAGCRILKRTQPIAGATTIRRSCPLLSLEEASAAMVANSLADAWGADMNPDAAKPPSPSPMITPLMLRIRSIWLRAGWRMLKRTQAMAGIMGSNSAMPRLSPSAISAICWAAKAASQELKVEKMAPAMAVPVREDDRLRFSTGFEEVRPFGRL